MDHGFSFGNGFGGFNPQWNNAPLSFGSPAGPAITIPGTATNAVGAPVAANLGGAASAMPGSTMAPWLQKLGGVEGLSSIMNGIGSLGQILGAMKGMKLAKEQLNFSKEAYQTNLKNTTQSYNTALEDRIRSRYAAENRGAADVDSYLSKHSL